MTEYKTACSMASASLPTPLRPFGSSGIPRMREQAAELCLVLGVPGVGVTGQRVSRGSHQGSPRGDGCPARRDSIESSTKTMIAGATGGEVFVLSCLSLAAHRCQSQDNQRRWTLCSRPCIYVTVSFSCRFGLHCFLQGGATTSVTEVESME